MVRTKPSQLIFDPTPIMRAFLAWGHGYQRLADLSGCSLGVVHRYVNGKSPRSKAAPRIAGVIGLDLDECWKIGRQEAATR